jgi:hypothetical protein
MSGAAATSAWISVGRITPRRQPVFRAGVFGPRSRDLTDVLVAAQTRVTWPPRWRRLREAPPPARFSALSGPLVQLLGRGMRTSFRARNCSPKVCESSHKGANARTVRTQHRPAGTFERARYHAVKPAIRQAHARFRTREVGTSKPSAPITDEPRHAALRGSTADPLQPCVHVGLDLRRRERSLVDAQIVDRAFVELPRIRIGAYAKLASSRGDARIDRPCGDQ